MDISRTYRPSDTEDTWYKHWLDKGYFHSRPDTREPYTIVMPPPNVTGVLHMGHVLNNTIQDVLIRRARMLGKNACWVPGTDHASIATEARVVKMLREKGIKKSDLSREEFLQYAWEWKEKYGGIILQQLRKLGCSCDWERTCFTMDPAYSDDVTDVFIQLYKEGKIYRGLRMINWDPEAKTALSNEEVIYREQESALYFVRYRIKNSDTFITVATTRPETIPGDTALCVHPDDARYQKYIGGTCLVPLVDREVPVIADPYVDRTFGTGALKVTPAHDANDYELGLRHNLEVIDIMHADGTLNANAKILVGEDRFSARKKILALLEEAGLLEKTETLQNSVGFSERTDAQVEPRLSMQWFLRMQELAEPALKAVLEGKIRLHPGKYVNTYKYWMENVRDWCISRQLWWGQRIPAWYNGEGDYVVAKSREEAESMFRAQGKSRDNLHQDADVLDTWASSWLWPLSVFDGLKDPDGEIRYYYPTNTLVTAPEIIFFWVARMIMAGYHYRGEKPFTDVYFTGTVRDNKRRKMSKSLGNSPEPLDLIRDFGADGVRMGILLCSPAGNDIVYDDKLLEQGRNFANKLWNAARLISGWTPEKGSQASQDAAVVWFTARLNACVGQVNALFEEFRISEALMALYTFVWEDFCSWYLEWIKPTAGKNMAAQTYEKTLNFLEAILKMLHPFMPFITEELWHRTGKRNADLIVSPWPAAEEPDPEVLEQVETLKRLIVRIRELRALNGISPKETLQLVAGRDFLKDMRPFIPALQKLANIASPLKSLPPDGHFIPFLAGRDAFKLGINKTADTGAELERLQSQLNYQRGFLESVERKLQNAKFVQGAPAEIVETERKKKADALEKIRILEESLSHLKGSGN